jgi:hypothetical protein
LKEGRYKFGVDGETLGVEFFVHLLESFFTFFEGVHFWERDNFIRFKFFNFKGNSTVTKGNFGTCRGKKIVRGYRIWRD